MKKNQIYEKKNEKKITPKSNILKDVVDESSRHHRTFLSVHLQRSEFFHLCCVKEILNSLMELGLGLKL